MTKKSVFPENFLWGASISAFQAEGAAYKDGKKASQMDHINQDTSFADTRITSDFYHHYKEDIALMREAGFTAFRFSIAWSRVFPDGTGKLNEKGIAFYDDLINELLANGIEPVPTLYHYDLPMALVKKYDGWIDRQVVEDFNYYAEFIIKRYRKKVKFWLTINEQSIIVEFWKKKNYIPEKYHNDPQIKFQINHHMNLAHAHVCQLVHKYVDNGVCGPAIGYSPIYGLNAEPKNMLAMLNAEDLKNHFYLDIYFKGRYPIGALKYLEEHGWAPKIEEGDMEIIQKGTSDFLGVNYYASKCVKFPDKDTEFREARSNLAGKKGAMGAYEAMPNFYEYVKNPYASSNDWDWTIDPTGMEYLLRDIYERYGIPMMITENGLGARDVLETDGYIHDDYRIDYWRQHLKAIQRAITLGVNVFGFLPWSFIDLLSTSNGYDKRYGLVYVDRTDDDVKNLKRYKKYSFYWYQKVIQTNGEDLE